MSIPRRNSWSLSRGKRILDIVAAGAGLLFLTPLLVAIAVLVRARLGHPVFFRQTRIGLDDRPFELVKFRTMTSGSDPAHAPLPDEQRLTRLGRLLRATSLDELPQLWNVLRGDMSLVGPRPLLPQYLPHYTREQARRHEVRPGITGWAQVHGRNALTWERKLALDTWYIVHASPALDLRIIGMTIRTVLARRGISAEGHATMPPFNGTDQ